MSRLAGFIAAIALLAPLGFASEVEATTATFDCTSGTTCTVPSDYSSLVSATALGCGGDGANGAATTPPTGGGGGGSGTYSAITSATNIHANDVLTVQIGLHGSGNATFLKDSTTTIILQANCGGNASGVTGGIAGSITGAVGTTKTAGIAGGLAAIGAAGTAEGGAGGGGSPGPTGVGKGGGANNGSSSARPSGGGGGGSNGGSAVGGSTPASSTVGGAGGASTSGSGGGAGGTSATGSPGTVGGGGGGAGGGGATAVGGAGSCDTSMDSTHSIGACGGGGGGGATAGTVAGNGGAGGTYGAGGGGAGATTALTGTGGAGGQGVIVVTYNVAAGGGNSGMLLRGANYWGQEVTPETLTPIFWHGGGGSPPVGLSINFGDKTLAGYGGVIPSGLSGALTINSETNGSAGASTDFVVNTDFDGVTGQIVPKGTYGAAAPAYNGPYTLNVSDSHGHSANVTINMVANVWSVKSQWNFATHGDTAASNQAQKVFSLNTLLHLGDTVSQRDDCACDVGVTPMFSPHPTSTTGYSLSPPAGGYLAGGGSYSGGTRVSFTCDTTNTSNDANGNPVNGGSCASGGWTVNNNVAGSTYADPIDFNYYHFYLNYQVPAGIQVIKYVLGPGNQAHGYNCLHCRIEAGPLYNAVESQIYETAGAQVANGAVDNSTIVGPFFQQIFCNAASISGVLDTTDPCEVEGNVFTGAFQSSINVAGKNGNPQFISNFFYSQANQDGNASVGDWFSIGAQTYVFVSGAPTAQGQVPILAGPPQTARAAACVINAGGTINWTTNGPGGSGTYSCVAGTDYWASETADTNVSAAWQFLGPNWYTGVTALATGTAGNSIALHAGNTVFGTCTDAGAPALAPGGACTISSGHSTSSTKSSYWTASTVLSSFSGTLLGGSVGVAAKGQLIYAPDHGDCVIFDSHLVAGTYPGGTIQYNICTRGVSAEANANVQQGMFTSHVFCCTTNMVDKNNVVFNGLGNGVTAENWSNPIISANTALSDFGGDAWNTSAPNFDTFTNQIFSGGVLPTQVLIANCTPSIVNSGVYVSGTGVITLTMAANPGFTAGVSVPLSSVTGTGAFASLNGTWVVISDSGVTVTLQGPVGAGAATITGGAIITGCAVSPGTLTSNLSNNTAISNGQTVPSTITPNPNASFVSSGSAAYNSLSLANVVLAYQATFPHFESGYQQNWTAVPTCPAGTGLCNPHAVNWAFTPAAGFTFTGTISSASKSMAVVSGSIPAQWSAINGPGIPSGDVVTAVSGSTLTLLTAATANETAQLFGTGAMNPGAANGSGNGDYNGALTPYDVTGTQACWNIAGQVFDATKSCAAQSLVAAP